ncbi:MAG TPA: FtsX-like permease family protein, partial [Bacteroidales bacterium]|nr:FtsX-like permease family protein [Bacteroidales bacterium]
QKEFAMLRSVGLSPMGIKRMLVLESLFLGLLPMLLSIPLNLIITEIFLKINMIYFSEFLPYLPALPIAVFGAVILFSVMLAYALGGKQLQSGAIVDILKDESV